MGDADPMIYDAAHDLAAHVIGLMVQRKRTSDSPAERTHWHDRALAVRAAVHAVDPDDAASVDALRLNLRRQLTNLTSHDLPPVRGTLDP